MSRVRDDARRNTRQQFATTRGDGSPVGSYAVRYQDGCAEAFTRDGDCFMGDIGGMDHEPGTHDRAHWWMRAPFSYERWDEQFARRYEDYYDEVDA